MRFVRGRTLAEAARSYHERRGPEGLITFRVGIGNPRHGGARGARRLLKAGPAHLAPRVKRPHQNGRSSP